MYLLKFLLFLSLVTVTVTYIPPNLKLGVCRRVGLCSTVSSTNDFAIKPATTSEKPKSSFGSCAALVAGTTIGGGFIALPYVTMPIGAAPSVISLVFCWIYLLLSAFSLAQATVGVMKYSNPSPTSVDNETDDYDHDKISVFRIARFCFGKLAAAAAGGVFTILMLSTLVAQLSKAGSLGGSVLSEIFPGPLKVLANFGLSGESLATVIYAATIASLTFVRGQGFAELMNIFLTATMILSFSGMVSLAPSSGWRPEGLKRADYSRLLPSFLVKNGSGLDGGASASWAIPVFLQLLVYAEVIPFISGRLRDEKLAKKAILYGSSIPLLMCIAFTVTALGLIPYHIPDVVSGKVLLKTLDADPVDILMAGTLSSINSSPISTLTNFLVSKLVSILAFSAITTTVIGSCLTMSLFVEDLLSKRHTDTSHDFIAVSPSAPGPSSPWRSRLDNPIRIINNLMRSGSLWVDTHKTTIARILAIAPATLVAGFGSRSLYYAATAFAGSFPVTMLWGLFPPLACLRLEEKHGLELTKTSRNLQIFQIIVSVLMLVSNLILSMR